MAGLQTAEAGCVLWAGQDVATVPPEWRGFALITRPRALLLDETFSALDADLRQQLRDEFSRRIAETGMACLLVTHDEAEARAMAQQAWRLQAGRLVALW